jgi:hypothetical protein
VLEVHAVEPEDHRRHREDRDPGRDPADVGVVAHLQLGQVRLQRTGEELVEGRDAVHVAHEVVVDVAEVVARARVDRQAGLARRQPLHGHGQRRDRAPELDDLALQAVDPLGRVARLLGEDVLLDLVDVLGQPLDHDGVVVDDAVGHGVEHGAGADAQELRPLLELEADVVQRAGLPMAHRDHEARADEDVDLADVDELLGVDVARGLEHEEQRVAVDVDLRPLVRVDGVLHGQRVQVEVAPDRLDDAGRRVVQPDPHEAVAAGGRTRHRRLEIDAAALALAGVVQRAVHDRRLDVVLRRARPRGRLRAGAVRLARRRRGQVGRHGRSVDLAYCSDESITCPSSCQFWSLKRIICTLWIG